MRSAARHAVPRRNRSQEKRGRAPQRCGAALKRAHVASRPNTTPGVFKSPHQAEPRKRPFPQCAVAQLPASLAKPTNHCMRTIQGGVVETKLGKENDVLVLLTPYPSQPSAKTLLHLLSFAILSPFSCAQRSDRGDLSRDHVPNVSPRLRLCTEAAGTGVAAAHTRSSQQTRHVGFCFAVKRHAQRGQECMIWRRDEYRCFALLPSKPPTHVSI
ncbi:hypothetical protein QBC34DRAFT_395451 [Podospora aff. communis PSN243]|uniref:Uncharacterized protein n=1 Tax=Podospora aff. communis PSN243 TaxID=3040156 RepID=A0AAV9H088_9PEZI|nr:hypothetical protein QBC34DRAFT_395451 [Podospora aff. communis PSN243]